MTDVETFDPFEDEDEATETVEVDPSEMGITDLCNKVEAICGKKPQSAQVNSWITSNPNFPVDFDDETGDYVFSDETVEWVVNKMSQTRGSKTAQVKRKIQANNAQIKRYQVRIAKIQTEIAELEKSLATE